jgi:hypothetical protein
MFHPSPSIYQVHCPNMKLAKKIQIEEAFFDFGLLTLPEIIFNTCDHGGCRPSFALRRKEDSSPIVCETFLTMFNLSRPFYMSSASNMDSLLLHILHDTESQTHPRQPNTQPPENIPTHHWSFQTKQLRQC